MTMYRNSVRTMLFLAASSMPFVAQAQASSEAAAE
jgi:hypothetical protein